MFENVPDGVTLYEVGPRDGLQNESRLIPTDDKVALIDALSDTGLRAIEITSFVNPKWIPQLADGVEVAQRVRRREGVGYSALVPNRQGFDAAVKAGMQEIAVFLSASETHNKKNVNKTIAATLAAFSEVVPPALERGMRVRAYVSTVYGCPYEGAVDPNKALELCRVLRAMGCYQISLGDTIGVGTPGRIRAMIEAVAKKVPIGKLAGHYHDTYGQALANIYASLEAGVKTFDSSVAGLGGCPYAKGATGNVATEDVIYMLDGLGIETGVDLEKLFHAGQFICKALGREPASRVARALAAKLGA